MRAKCATSGIIFLKGGKGREHAYGSYITYTGEVNQASEGEGRRGFEHERAKAQAAPAA